MKRQLCRTGRFNCDDGGMEELNAAALSRRKESSAPLEERVEVHLPPSFVYPKILRLRVVQIVCGISLMVMGSVAFIEERQKFNMGLGVPAGAVSVLAAAVSIHTARGLYPVSGSTAVSSYTLWVIATCFLLALAAQCCRTIAAQNGIPHYGKPEEDSSPSPDDLIIIAVVHMALIATILCTAGFCARVDYLMRRFHDPIRPVARRRVSESPAVAATVAAPEAVELKKGSRVAWQI